MNKTLRKPIVAGNWKMNGSRSLVEEFCTTLSAAKLDNVESVICPPAPYLALFTGSDFALGGQDVSALANGAHTGDVSVNMLQEFGCQYVIVGHSERREDHGESSKLVAEKAAAVADAGLVPVVCVGESLNEREAGTYEAFISAQLDALLEGLNDQQLSACVIAYEPIWAIGTGKTASPEQAQAVHAFIRQHVAKKDQVLASKMRILYGGSVKPDNAHALFGQDDVDGGLIGGASLKVNDFIEICQAAN